MKTLKLNFLLVPLVFCVLLCSQAWAAYTTVSCLYGETGTCRQANSCSQADVQSAISASSSGGTGYVSPTSFNGDGVYIPACSATTWSSPVSWSDKNINVIGGGSSSTIITPTGDAFDIGVSDAGGDKAAFRVSGIGFTGAPSGSTFNFNNGNPNMSTSAGFFRIDHIAMNYTSTANVIIVYGPVWGLIDHVTATFAGGNFLEQADFLNPECSPSGSTTVFMGEYSGRTIAMGLGTENAVYVENSTFTFTGGAMTAAVLDSEAGGQRTVFRYNTITGPTFLYAHWSKGGQGGYCSNGQWGGHKYEIYNNTFNGQSVNGYPMRFGSGTGVIFNNTITGYSDPTVHVDETRGCGGESTNSTMYDCNGTRAWDGNAGDANAPGWPCAGQIGTGCIAGNCARNGMNSVPLLLWNNGAQAGCSTGGACTNSVTVDVDGPMGSANTCTRTMTNYISSTPHSVSGPLNGAVDYCEGSTMPATCGIYTNTYMPFRYPHPLQSAGLTPPTGLILIK